MRLLSIRTENKGTRATCYPRNMRMSVVVRRFARPIKQLLEIGVLDSQKTGCCERDSHVPPNRSILSC